MKNYQDEHFNNWTDVVDSPEEAIAYQQRRSEQGAAEAARATQSKN
jgi:hypothetical protein